MFVMPTGVCIHWVAVDTLAPFAFVVFDGNIKVLLEPEDVIVDGLYRCFDTMFRKVGLDAVGVLGMLLCGMGIEVISNVKELYALSRRTPASCRPFCIFLTIS